MTVFTIGHSTRGLDEFLALLSAHRIGLVVDVRRFPASRRNPHFARAALADAAARAGVEYRWGPLRGPCRKSSRVTAWGIGQGEALGGRRSRRPGSPHTAWHVPAFAGYADHMDGAEFAAAAAALVEWARSTRTAILCAEARPEQCHRRLIADWLTARGATVEHILDARCTARHQLPEFARVEGDRVIYDVGQLRLDAD